MGEDDIRNYLSRQAIAPPQKQQPVMRAVRRKPAAPKGKPEASFGEFSASHMFCARCRQATPVRQKILLYLPDGDLYDYSCTVCGSSTGTRKVTR